VQATGNFTRVDADDLAQALKADPRTLLVLRTIVGFTKDELAHSTQLVAERLGLASISGAKVDSMERKGSASSDDVCRVVAETLAQVMAGTLFGDPPGELKPKQAKPDTAGGWTTVAHLAAEGVPYSMLLHQRHYGGAFRQVLDATSTARGNLIEDAVEVLFKENGVPYIRTGSHNQGDIAARFEVRVTPAPDFVVFDLADRLQGMLECKGASDGGTARALLCGLGHTGCAACLVSQGPQSQFVVLAPGPSDGWHRPATDLVFFAPRCPDALQVGFRDADRKRTG
jgi:hypothetical protein